MILQLEKAKLDLQNAPADFEGFGYSQASGRVKELTDKIVGLNNIISVNKETLRTSSESAKQGMGELSDAITKVLEKAAETPSAIRRIFEQTKSLADGLTDPPKKLNSKQEDKNVRVTEEIRASINALRNQGLAIGLNKTQQIGFNNETRRLAAITENNNRVLKLQGLTEELRKNILGETSKEINHYFDVITSKEVSEAQKNQSSEFEQQRNAIQQINESYPALFDTGDDGEDAGDGGETDPTGFTKSFGWIYNAKMVSEFEGISLDAVWNLPVLQFLNGLLYIKQKRLFDEYQYKQGTGGGAR